MKFKFVCGFIFLINQFNIAITQTWEQTTSFPGTPRDDASYFKIGSKHYIGTGREVGFGCTRDFYFFDESSLSWGNSSPLPTGKERQYTSSVSHNGKGYLFGGVDCAGIYQNDFWSYDPSSDSWSELNALPTSGRAGMVQFVLHDTLYIVGGRNSTGILNEVWTYDFTNQNWTQKNMLPSNGIWRGIAFTFQNRAFIGLGRNNLNNQTELNTEILEYQSEFDFWSTIPNLNWGQRCYVGSAQTDSLLFLFGGLDSIGQILTSVERIRLSDFSSEILQSFSSIPRKGGVAFLAQNDLYYSTGVSTDTRFDETWHLMNVVSLDKINLQNLRISPNPSSEKVFILDIPSSLIGKIATIKDIEGKSVLEIFLNSNEKQIDVSNLKSGVYLFALDSKVYRFIVN